MKEFKVQTKHWPTGTDLSLDLDSTIVTGAVTFNRSASSFITDGTNNFTFLFWNTGRHITNRRNVKWIFTALDWSVWTATRWYGDVGPGGGDKVVDARAFSGSLDTPLLPTPIDGPASTFPPGAWPLLGDDHRVSTQNGAVSLMPLEPLTIGTVEHHFAQWLELVGGGVAGDFTETDAGGGGSGTDFTWSSAAPASATCAQGGSKRLMAAYGPSHSTIDVFRPPRDFEDLPTGPERGPWKPPIWWDPNPEDWIRRRWLEDLIRTTEPGDVADTKRLAERVSKFSKDELRTAIRALKSSVNLGNATLATLEAQLKKGAK